MWSPAPKPRMTGAVRLRRVKRSLCSSAAVRAAAEPVAHFGGTTDHEGEQESGDASSLIN